VRRIVESARTHLKAAARGLPRREEILALPRQRFDSVERRLGSALLANTRTHAMRHARVASRLSPRLVGIRIERATVALGRLEQRADAALGRGAGVHRTRLARVGGRLSPQLLANRVRRSRDRISGLGQMLSALSYQGVLKRGFALVRDAEGRALRNADAVQSGARIEIEFHDGRIGAQVTEPGGGSAGSSGGGEHADASPPAPSPGVRPTRPRGSGASGQGSLF
jgi:exodeoxyribonuclease VII large subunit